MMGTSELRALSELELYEKLNPHVLTPQRLQKLGYPEEDVAASSAGDSARGNLRRKAPLGARLRVGFKSEYECRRCKKFYPVDTSTGWPLASAGACVYHPGHFWKVQLNNQWNCCRGSARSPGCCTNGCHVHEQALELCNYTGFVRTQARGRPAGCKVFAMDGEMCYTTIGLELTQLTVLNYKKDIVYETLCKPSNPILDYNTRYSGLRESDLAHVKKSLRDVQQDLLELIPAESIIVGHGLDHDMIELKMFHDNFVDTVALFPHRRGLPWKNGLKLLVKTHLGRDIQNGLSHDSKEDAGAAFDLALAYVAKRSGALGDLFAL